MRVHPLTEMDPLAITGIICRELLRSGTVIADTLVSKAGSAIDWICDIGEVS